MNCTDSRAMLSDLLDGSLTAAARAQVTSHLEVCEGCRTVLADLRLVRETARALPPTTVPESLWPQVRARIENEIAQQARRTRPRWWAGPAWWPAWGTLAAAATLVLAVSVGAYYAWRRPAAPPASQVAAGQSAVDTYVSEAEAGFQHYSKAIAALEQIAATDRDLLPSDALEVLKKNHSVLDQVIAESRSAVQAQPSDVVAQASLFDALQRKVGLLRDTISLINEMRKGDQAGAARIVGNLGKSS